MSHAVRRLPALRRPVRTAKPCRKLEPRLDCLEDRNLLAVIAVTNTSNAGAGSLRAAINQANAQMGADVIQFGGLVGTISLTSAELLITGDLTIEGPGADTLAVSGEDALRIFHVSGDVEVAISDLWITDGAALDLGGAILNEGGALTLEGVVVDSSTVRSKLNDARGGGIASVNGASLTILDSTITLNTALGGAATDDTGGNGLDAQGGGIYIGLASALTISNSIVSSNAALGGAGGSGFAGSDGGRGGDAAGGGLFLGSGTAGDLAGVAFSANTATGGPGGTGDGSGAGGAGGAGTGGGIASLALNLDVGPDFVSGSLSGFDFNTAAGGAGAPGGSGGAGGHGAGGGLFHGGGTVSLGDLSLLYNLASGGAGGSGQVGGGGGAGEGGGVFSDVDADLTVQNTHFVENAATGGLGGSGVYLKTSGRGGPGSGGGLFGAGGVSAFVTIQVDTTFTRNKAAGGNSAVGHGGPGAGGAIALIGAASSQPPLMILATEFELNQALGGAAGSAPGAEGGDARGGALFASGPAMITSSPFRNNTAQGGPSSTSGIGRGGDASGGAVHGTELGFLSLNAADVVGNRAFAGDGLLGKQTSRDRVGASGGDAFGGGIAVVDGGSLHFQGGTIDDNTARGGHGGFNAKTKAAEGNGPGGDASGGGVFSRNSSVTLDLGDEAGLRSNSARGGNARTGETGTGYGGGLSGVASTLSILGGQIYSNGAFGGHTDVLIGGSAYGGGVYVTGPGTTLDIDGATFYQNIAYGGTGGDIDEEGPATGGSATGGALCIQGIHQADIRDSFFIYNHALGAYGALNGGFALGGGLAVFGSDVALTDCLVANNEAIGSPNDPDEDPDPSFGYGGGIYADAALVILTNTDVEDNDASTDGDDLYGDDFGP